MVNKIWWNKNTMNPSVYRDHNPELEGCFHIVGIADKLKGDISNIFGQVSVLEFLLRDGDCNKIQDIINRYKLKFIRIWIGSYNGDSIIYNVRTVNPSKETIILQFEDLEDLSARLKNKL